MDQFHKVYDLAETYHETNNRLIKPRLLQCSVGLGCFSALCTGLNGSGNCLFLRGIESIILG